MAVLEAVVPATVCGRGRRLYAPTRSSATILQPWIDRQTSWTDQPAELTDGLTNQQSHVTKNVLVSISKVRILEYKSIICSGFKAVMHINAAAEEVEIRNLHSTVDPKTGKD